MTDQVDRNYTVHDIREIIMCACDVRSLSTQHIVGMVCLADLLSHIGGDGAAARDVKSSVHNYFNTHKPRLSDSYVEWDD